MGVLDIDLPIFSPEQAQASPFASQSKLKVVLTRLPFVICDTYKDLPWNAF